MQICEVSVAIVVVVASGPFLCYSNCDSAPDHDRMVGTLGLNSGDPEFSIPALITSWMVGHHFR